MLLAVQPVLPMAVTATNIMIIQLIPVVLALAPVVTVIHLVLFVKPVVGQNVKVIIATSLNVLLIRLYMA